jgi:hypothetical protein
MIRTLDAGARMRNTLDKTPTRVAAVAVAMALAALAGCSDSAPARGNDPKASPSRTAVADSNAVLNASQLKQAMPDLQSMPIGWKAGALTARAKDISGRSLPCKSAIEDYCGMKSYGSGQYDNPAGTGNVWFELAAYPDKQTADAAYKRRRISFQSPGAQQIAMPAVGNESTAEKTVGSKGEIVSLVMRVGTVVVATAYTDRPSADPNTMLTIARMQAERLQQAEQGQTPTAHATAS